MSYHLRPIITQGVYGETSKIREELEELEEALDQDNRILALCELADLYGAIEGVAEKLGVSMLDLLKMSNATTRAFESGSRVPKNGVLQEGRLLEEKEYESFPPGTESLK